MLGSSKFSKLYNRNTERHQVTDKFIDGLIAGHSGMTAAMRRGLDLEEDSARRIVLKLSAMS